MQLQLEIGWNFTNFLEAPHLDSRVASPAVGEPLVE